jgi:hypothetical protein
MRRLGSRVGFTENLEGRTTTMLTVKQALVATTRRKILPLHVRDLGTAFNLKSFSVREIVNAVEGQKWVYFVHVRDLSLFKSANSLQELRAAWKSSVPSRTTLIQLSELLSRSGASLRFLSKDWQDVGIQGTTQSLAGVPTARLTGQNYDQARDLASAAGVAGGIILGIGLSTGNFPIAVAGLTFAGISVFGFYDISVLEADEASAPVATVPPPAGEGV